MALKRYIKLSRIPQGKPVVSMVRFDELSWNIVDHILYLKALDESGKEIIVAIPADNAKVASHARLHEVDSEQDHAPAREEDFGKYVRAHPQTGAIIFDEGGDKHFSHQVTNMDEIVVNHQLNKNPSVHIISLDNQKVIAEITHIDQNTTRIEFSDYFSGTVIFN